MYEGHKKGRKVGLVDPDTQKLETEIIGIWVLLTSQTAAGGTNSASSLNMVNATFACLRILRYMSRHWSLYHWSCGYVSIHWIRPIRRQMQRGGHNQCFPLPQADWLDIWLKNSLIGRTKLAERKAKQAFPARTAPDAENACPMLRAVLGWPY